jgi:hypothetical protein
MYGLNPHLHSNQPLSGLTLLYTAATPHRGMGLRVEERGILYMYKVSKKYQINLIFHFILTGFDSIVHIKLITQDI